MISYDIKVMVIRGGGSKYLVACLFILYLPTHTTAPQEAHVVISREGQQINAYEVSCTTPTCAARNIRSLIVYPIFWHSSTEPGSLPGIGA